MEAFQLVKEEIMGDSEIKNKIIDIDVDGKGE